MYLLTLLAPDATELEQAGHRGSGGAPQEDLGTSCGSSDLTGNDRSSRLAWPHLPGPEKTKALDARRRLFRARRWPAPSASRPRCRRARPKIGGPLESISGVFSRRLLKHADLVAQSQVLEPEGSTRTGIQRQGCEECLREMSIGENYKKNLTPIRSNISRFSRGTVQLKLAAAFPTS